VDEAIQSGANVILLDNLTTDQMKEAMARIAGRAKVEISGGITLDRIPELAAIGADFVSVGALTHSAAAADLSFELEPDA
jgi:nicotinate-nucleotide pyrophosphorylase (carboxylating)